MESPHDTNRLWYFTSDLIYMVIKGKISIKCNATEFDGWNFFVKDWLSNFNVECVFQVGDYHIWSFTNVQRKSVGLEPVINSYKFPVHCGMNIVNVTVGCKTVVSSAKWTKRIWVDDLCMSLMYKRKSTEQHDSVCFQEYGSVYFAQCGSALIILNMYINECPL